MDNLFYWLSKLVWILISPDSLLMLWLGAGVVLFWVGKLVWAKRLFIGLLLVMLFIGLFPVGEWLFYPLEARYPSRPDLRDVDGIVVLSGAEDPMRSVLWDQVLVNEAAERDLAFMMLARTFPDAKLVFTGGASSMIHQEYKAADIARRLFQEQGMDLTHITFERMSRNTWENVVLSKELVQPQKDEKWVLITTGWHMPRAMGIFCKAEWSVIPYPVDFRSKPGVLLRVDWGFASHLNDLVVGVKELMGFVAYKMMGKSC